MFKITPFEKYIWFPLYRTCRNIMDIPRKIKWGLQTLFRGYSDPDIWNLDNHLVDLITVRLRAFKKLDRTGFPAVLDKKLNDSSHRARTLNEKNGMKKWNKILERMLWSFENYGKDSYCFTDTGSDIKWSEPDEKGGCQLLDTGIKANKKKLKTHWRKTEEGLDLFREHFMNLWD